MSQYQSAKTAETMTLGFDIGGTNMRVAAINAQGEICDAASVATPTNSADLDAGIIALVEEFRTRYDIGAVGLAVAGFLDPRCEIVRFAPHLPWRDRPVRDMLSRALALPVKLEHDANAAAWGEYRFGGARHRDNWVLFALGTGIGATLMVDGEIYRGAFGTAPEFGHLTVVPQGRKCPCGKQGCLERYCSGTALEFSATEFIAQHPEVSSELRTLHQQGKLRGKDIARLAAAGDELALAVFADFSRWLGQALSLVADTLDPELILIGGGVSGAHDLYLRSAVGHMKEQIVGAAYRPHPTVAIAELGADAGMIGVADLARRLIRV